MKHGGQKVEAIRARKAETVRMCATGIAQACKENFANAQGKGLPCASDRVFKWPQEDACDLARVEADH